MKNAYRFAVCVWFTFLGILLLMFSSCKTMKAVPVKEITTEIITETVHDTVFETETDSSSYRALLECQKGKVVVKQVNHAAAGKYLKAPKFTVKDNVAECDCEAEKQKLYAQWKSKNTQKQIIKEVPVFIEAQLSKWQRLFICLGQILLIILIPLIIYGAYRLYRKFRP